jgi:hypothetical protein
LQLAACLGGQLPRRGQVTLRGRPLDLRQRHRGQHADNRDGRREPEECEPDPAHPQGALAHLPTAAGRQEGGLHVVEPIQRLILPVGQARTPVEVSVLAAVLIPLGGRLGQATVGPEQVAVLGEPVP